MSSDYIVIQNAHANNLKNISTEIPKHKVVAFTGVSGSGKSSLLFDTIYTEAQRQLIETFSTFARKRLPKLSRPDVDDILNLSTAMVIDQKKMGNNLRSTVGTATEVNTYLRLLFSRIGKPYLGASFLFSFNNPMGMCEHCHGLGKIAKIDLDLFLDREKSIREGGILHIHYKVGSFLWNELVKFKIVDPDKKIKDYSPEELNLLLYSEPFHVKGSKEAVSYNRNFEGLVRKLENSMAQKGEDEADEEEKNAYNRFFKYETCPQCQGTRINTAARDVKIHGASIDQVCRWELPHVLEYLETIDDPIAEPIVRKAKYILKQLIHIGVGYLSLERPVGTLSGGESQRVKMARQLDCNLVDLLYVLDEPTTGLHPRDTQKLIQLLYELKNRGNSVFVVEHDPEVIKACEWIVDIGPQAGTKGGTIVYNGPAQDIQTSQSITATTLHKEIPLHETTKTPEGYYEIRNATANNLKNITVRIPKGMLTCVTGVSGSGKSSLIHECFLPQHPQATVIDQSPIGRSSRANPLTFTGIFDAIRKEFAADTGADPALFSFNSKGACPKCNGQGFISYELNFLDSVKSLCDECEGKRYHADVLNHRYQGKNIADVLNLSVDEALAFFTTHKINQHLKLLKDVGLGYLKLGQTLSSLSGGESQRLKIAAELQKESNIYVMDEPTTGLHRSDIDTFFQIIKKLVDRKNTVIVIEHNTDIIKRADWIIDMGPEGGHKGGMVMAEGTPAQIKANPASITGRYL